MNKDKSITIALDGPAGAGKSTIAERIAGILGIHHLDSGALFRAAALKAIRSGVDTKDEAGLMALLKDCKLDIRIQDGQQHTYLDGKDVSQAIRAQEVGQGASDVGTIRCVREFVTQRVREIAQDTSLIVDGRDIGSVMLPEADYKFFLTATSQERALRRMRQLHEMGNKAVLSEIEAEIVARDRQDASRAIAPLIQAPDAVVIDSTQDTVEQVVARILSYMKQV
jgi:cytidylate kinase